MSDDQKRDEIIKAATDIEFRPSTEIARQNLSQATKLPFDKLAVAGVALGSLPEAVRTVTTHMPGGEVLLRATDKFGNTIPSNLLQRFNDGSGMMGSTRINGEFGQVRLHEVASGAGNAVTTVPYDPTMLFVAAALAQVNEKLDAIQETQEEMFEFLRREKRSKQEGDLNTLTDVMNNYKFNWDSETYRNSKHVLVQSIARRAQENIVFYRNEAMASFEKKGFVTLGKDTKVKAEKMTASMQDYQLALYLYSFASFLEVMLLGNFSADYLDSVSSKVKELTLEYRELYTQCYNVLEAATKSTLEAGVLSGIAFAGKALGKAVEKTPIGDRTQIDETLIGASEVVANKRDEFSVKQTGLLIAAKENVTLPFSDGIDRISYLYNQEFELLMDSEAMYLLPA